MQARGLLLLMLLTDAARGEAPAAPVSSQVATRAQPGQVFDVRLEKAGTTLPVQVLDARQDALLGDLLLLRVCPGVNEKPTIDTTDGGKLPQFAMPYDLLTERGTFDSWQKTPSLAKPCQLNAAGEGSWVETRRLFDGGWLRVVNGGFERILTLSGGPPPEDVK